jgi:glycosyltransferase involved in cell wall biosynthesis
MEVYPKVSIMIPTYCQDEYIEQAVMSALEQSYPNIEIIVSDDSENDATFEVLNKYIEKGIITYIKNKPRHGRVKNYNQTLMNSTNGEWILNLDGDDFLVNKNFISECYGIIKNSKDKPAFIFGREYEYNDTTKSMFERKTSLTETQSFEGTELFLNKRKLGINFYHLSTLYNREKAIDSNFYTIDCLGADTLSFYSMMPGETVVFINSFGGAWRTHSENDSFTDNITELVNNITSAKNIRKNVINKSNLTDKQFNKWYTQTATNRFESYFLRLISGQKYTLAKKLLKSTVTAEKRIVLSYFISPKRLIRLLCSFLNN